MKKSRLKNYLKIGILLFGITLINISCQKDDIELDKESNTTKDTPFKMKVITSKEVNKNSFVTKQLQKFKDIKTNVLNRDVYNSEYEFNVDTDYSKYIESSDGSFHSYTFNIKKEEDSELIENLVISLQADGTYKTDIVVYNFIDDNQLEINTVPLENFDISQYLARFDFSYSCTTTVTYTVIFNTSVADCPNGPCYEVTVNSVDTNCTYTYSNVPEFVDANDSGGGTWGNTVWTTQGGGATAPNAANTITTTSPFVPAPNPCVNINKLESDDVFKQKMVILKNAASQWSFEKLFAVKTDQTPNDAVSQSDNFDYSSFQGTIQNPHVTWSGMSANTFKGIIHSHYDGLLSVLSVADLTDMYNIMKISAITDDFFYGVVNSSGSAYFLQIKDRAAFIAFGNEYLSSANKIFKFTRDKYEKKYDIKRDNPNSTNELGFVKMLQDLGAGVEIFKSTDTTFSNYKKLNVKNNQVVPSDCN